MVGRYIDLNYPQKCIQLWLHIFLLICMPPTQYSFNEKKLHRGDYFLVPEYLNLWLFPNGVVQKDGNGKRTNPQ